MIIGIGLSEKFHWAKSNSALLLDGSVDDPGDDAREIVGEGCKRQSSCYAPFQQRLHLLIASILIVLGDEFRMLDELRGVLSTPLIRILPTAEFHVAPDFVFMLVTNVAKLENFKPGLERPPPPHPRYG